MLTLSSGDGSLTAYQVDFAGPCSCPTLFHGVEVLCKGRFQYQDAVQRCTALAHLRFGAY